MKSRCCARYEPKQSQLKCETLQGRTIQVTIRINNLAKAICEKRQQSKLQPRSRINEENKNMQYENVRKSHRAGACPRI